MSAWFRGEAEAGPSREGPPQGQPQGDCRSQKILSLMSLKGDCSNVLRKKILLKFYFSWQIISVPGAMSANDTSHDNRHQCV